MREHDIHLMRLLGEQIAKRIQKERGKWKPPRQKPWKDLSGHEWTERCIQQDWEKDRPYIGWWKNEI